MLRDNIPEIRGWGDKKKKTVEVLSLGSLWRGLSEVQQQLLGQGSSVNAGAVRGQSCLPGEGGRLCGETPRSQTVGFPPGIAGGRAARGLG